MLSTREKAAIAALIIIATAVLFFVMGYYQGWFYATMPR